MLWDAVVVGMAVIITFLVAIECFIYEWEEEEREDDQA